jgi:hypothetical protein
MSKYITADVCSDPGIMLVAVQAAKDLASRCKTAIVILTSNCVQDGHGTHVSVAVLNKTGSLTPSEARAACRRLRSLADELEERFAPKGSEN